MRILIFLLFLSTFCQAQIGNFSYKTPEPNDTVGAEAYSDTSGILAGGGAEWYTYNSLPTADDTIETAFQLFTTPVTDGTYFIKGRINLDTAYGLQLPKGVTLTGTHRKPGGFLSELYWTENHGDTLTGSIDDKSMFHFNNDTITFIGLKIAGRDTIISQVEQNRRGVSADGLYAKFVNCEFGFFERTGIDMQNATSGASVDVEYCYFHDIHFYDIIMIRSNTILDVKYSYFRFPWHAVATNNDIFGFRYRLDGCIFEKETRPHFDVWNDFQYGGREMADVHAPGAGASGEIDIFVTYCSFYRQPVNRVYDPWEETAAREVYDLWIRDDALSDTMDTLVFDHNLMNRPFNATHSNSYRIDVTPNVSIITNNVVNPHPVK